MKTYIVIISDGNHEWIEHESNNIDEAKSMARYEFERSEQMYTVELGKMIDYDFGTDAYKYELIEV